MLPSSPLPYCTLLKEIMNSLHKRFVLFLHRFISIFLSFLPSTQLFICISRDSQIFCILSYAPIPQYLFYCLNCSSFGHQKLFQLGTVTLWHHCEILFVCLFLSTSLVPFTTRYSRVTFYVFCPSSKVNHVSQNSCSFHWRMLLEIEIWVLDAASLPLECPCS